MGFKGCNESIGNTQTSQASHRQSHIPFQLSLTAFADPLTLHCPPSDTLCSYSVFSLSITVTHHDDAVQPILTLVA